MWIVFGNKTELQRVPGGLRVQRLCGACGEWAIFYEKHVTRTFRLYFMDVFDYERHRVMACGCCGVYYATDELGEPSAGGQNLSEIGNGIDRATSAVGGYLERAGSAVEEGLSSLFSGRRERAPAPAPRREQLGARHDSDIDTGVGRVDDDMEARFRELEEKARKGDS